MPFAIWRAYFSHALYRPSGTDQGKRSGMVSKKERKNLIQIRTHNVACTQNRNKTTPTAKTKACAAGYTRHCTFLPRNLSPLLSTYYFRLDDSALQEVVFATHRSSQLSFQLLLVGTLIGLHTKWPIKGIPHCCVLPIIMVYHTWHAYMKGCAKNRPPYQAFHGSDCDQTHLA